jgi:hypothetical protein
MEPPQCPAILISKPTIREEIPHALTTVSAKGHGSLCHIQNFKHLVISQQRKNEIKISCGRLNQNAVPKDRVLTGRQSPN